MKNKSVQWKLAFMNSNINWIPQDEKAKKENLNRLILELKSNDLYDKLEDELNEYVEFEELCLNSTKLENDLLFQMKSQFELNQYEWEPIECINFDLSVKKMSRTIPGSI
jgi:hypothetical protein